MENSQNNSKLKAIILILSLLLLGSLAYMFKMSTDTKSDIQERETKYETILSEKDLVLKDLEEMKAKYEEEISSNTTLRGDLEAEKAKVEALIARVKKGESVAHYKNDYLKLKREMDSLIAENLTLKEELVAVNSSLSNTKDSLLETRTFNEKLLDQNDDLSKKYEKGQRLVITNLNTVAVKERNSGKQIETEKASRVDKLKISFTIAENELAQTGVRDYYVQIIDSKNNVIGEKKTITFNEKILNYSFITSVKFENNTMNVVKELSGSDFEKGTYYVNIFDKGELVANSQFQLK